MQSELYFSKATLFFFLTLFSVSLQAQRVEQGLNSLFLFGAESGQYVVDHSQAGVPLLLEINNNNTNYSDQNGLILQEPALIRSVNSAEQKLDMLIEAEEISVELWIRSSDMEQAGPARILTCSQGSGLRNFTIGQENDQFIARLRTTESSENGMPNFSSPASTVSGELQHLVYTFQNGVERFYIDGDLVSEGDRTGNFTNWNNNYRIALGDELGADRPWLGKYRLAAIYHSALDPDEVEQNFQAGIPNAGESSNETCDEECWVEGFGPDQRFLWLPGLPGNIHHRFEIDEAGVTLATFDDGTAHIYGNNINMQDPDLGFYIDVWFTDKMNWEEWSALGRDWKGDPADVGDNYLLWDFYIVDPEKENVLIGTGDLEGSLINLTHKPANYLYGFQLGEGANDQNDAYGMSCWFFCDGVVNGQEYSGQSDINGEGECFDLPVIACAADVSLTCEDDLSPENTGQPVLYCPDDYSLSYTDEILTDECPLSIIRTWTATDSDGNEVHCEQSITVIDEEAPEISTQPFVFTECLEEESAFALVVSDNCDDSPEIFIDGLTISSFDDQDCGPGAYRTQTPGGWGANPAGNNPGTFLHEHFDEAFPNGLTIGCENTLHLSSAQAITDFLPSGGTPSALPEGQLIDPTDYNNVLAGHLVAISLSLGFDATFDDFGSGFLSLGSLEILEGEYQGFTVADVVQMANDVIGGCSDESPSSLGDVLASINQNFVDGAMDGGFLNCSLGLDCPSLISATITAMDACGNTSTADAQLIYAPEDIPEIPVIEEQITVSCDDIPEPLEIGVACPWAPFSISVVESNYSGGCNTSIERIYTINNQCGEPYEITQYIAIVDFESPDYEAPSSTIMVSCSELPEIDAPTVTDNCDEELEISFVEETIGSGCDSQLLRTYTAVDDCGNEAVHQQLIDLVDQSPPVISGVQPELNLNCEGKVPALFPIVVDDCDLNPTVSIEEETSVNDCTTIITRTVIATDQCGNASSAVQIITITDNEAPVFTEIPEDLSLSCSEELPNSTPLAEDACGEVIVDFNDELFNVDGACDQIIRTFTAVDDCGNTAEAEQVITIVDNQAPEIINVPASGDYNCSELQDASAVAAIDNCDNEVELTFEEQFSGDDCNPEILRTWTAVDDCGNTSVATQMLTVIDNAAPVFINTEEFIEISCIDEIPADEPELVDQCSPEVNISLEETVTGEGCNLLITKVWSATDLCGNSAEFTQQIQVLDEQAPVFDSFPQDLQLSCGSNPIFEEPTVSDNCSTPELNLEEVINSDDCGTMILRTWTAVDECGNTASQTQEIFIGDLEAPEFTNGPQDVLIDCNADIPEPVQPMAQDECSEVVISFEEEILPGACPSNYIIARNWTATDACGNTAVYTQEIIVADMTAPVFDNLPEDITAECGNIPDAPLVTASDDCSEVSVSLEITSDEGGCPNLIRTWTATDACGNTATAVQTVFVEDTEPPVITGVPDDMVVDCNNIPEMPEPEVSDNCDDEVALTSNVSVIGTGCEYTILRTWIASDDCGNTTIISQSINVEDNSSPTFLNELPDEVLECSDWEAYPLPDVFDDCGATVIVDYMDEFFYGANNCSFDVVRTYTATDACGNTSMATQNFQVTDQSPPSFIGVPSNLYVSCGDVPEPADVVAIDACSEVVDLSFNEELFGEDCDYFLQRTWTATDACGNSASIAHLVYVSDDEAPIISGLENVTVDCTEDWPEVAEPTITDNCTVSPDFSVIEFTETDDCTETLTRIFTATDECGNTATAIQTISRSDLLGPVIEGVPASITVTCADIPPASEVQVTDNCSEPLELNVEDVYIGGDCPFTIQRIWTATDACGNSTSATREIYVIDNESPVMFDLPEDVTVSCDNIPDAIFPGVTDNCVGDLQLSVEENWGESNNCSLVLLRTYTAIDLCGNSSAYTQTITVIDDEAPQLPQMSEELFVQCNEIPVFEMLSASDNCDDEVEVSLTEMTIQGDCPQEEQIIREWTAVDDCGNTTVVTQSIYVVDNTLPSLIGVPEDITVTCENIPEIPEVLGWDECQGYLPVSLEEEIILNSEENDGCELGNAASPAGTVAIWLPTINGYEDEYVFSDDPGLLEEDPANATAHITGVVYNPTNANQGWIIDMYLENARDWEAWSALGRSYKDDLGFGEPYHESWTYYEINGELSKLIGFGEFEGVELSLTHAPSSYYYGVQIGLGANNRNAEYGMSGWFDISGELNGAPVEGMGDILTENNCCPEQEIIRTWTVTDCAGNTMSYTQTITVTSGFSLPSLALQSYSEEGEFDVIGTEGETLTLTFRLPQTTQASILVYDARGSFLEKPFEGMVKENAEYRIPFDKSIWKQGTYIFHLTDGKSILLSDKELILK